MGNEYTETYFVNAFSPDHEWGIKPCEHMIWHPAFPTVGIKKGIFMSGGIDATCALDSFMCRHSEYNRIYFPEKLEEKCHNKKYKESY